MNYAKQEILKVFIEEPVQASFATVSKDGKPCVRYVMINIDRKDMSMRFSTFVNSPKVVQIANQPEVSLTCCGTDPESSQKIYLQIKGKASFSTEADERALVWHSSTEKIFQKMDNPNFGVIKIVPYKIEVTLQGDKGHETLVWKNIPETGYCCNS